MISRGKATLIGLARSAGLGPRGRRVAHTTLWSVIAKCSSAANLFLAVPFVLQALGSSQFGAWATLVSLVAFAGFLDFGFGNGTMNLVASAHGRGDDAAVAVVLREGRDALLRISLALAFAVAFALPLVPWHKLLGLPASMASTSRWCAAVVLASIVAAVPLNLANRAQLGIGKGNLAYRWQAVGQVLSLGLVISTALSHGSLPSLTAATVFPPLLASLMNTLGLWRGLPKAPPAREREDKSHSIRHTIQREGVMFFGLQLSAALAYSADLPLISAMRGPVEAGTYALVQRLFSIIPLGLSMVWIPLWPVYRQALAAHDHSWVLQTLRLSQLVAGLAAFVGAVVLYVGFDPLVALWLHRPLYAGTFLIAGFACWSVIDALGTAMATFLNAASIVRYQVIIACLFAPLCFAVKMMALAYGAVELLPWVTVITYSLVSLLPTSILWRQLVSHALGKNYA